MDVQFESLQKDLKVIKQVLLNFEERLKMLEQSRGIEQKPFVSAAPIIEEKAQPKEKKESYESKITGKWFAGVGVVALLFGIGFFLKYAFENNLIGEVGRIIMGIMVGVILLVLGNALFQKEKYRQYSFFLSGGGLAVLYLSIFASFSFYHQIEQFTAFLIMMLITACGAFSAVRQDSQHLAIMGVLGGFLTPILLSTGVDNQIGLFSYILLLDLGFLAICYYKKWPYLFGINFIGTYIMYFAWKDNFYTYAKLVPTMTFLTAFFVIFLAAPFLMSVFKGIRSTWPESIVSYVNSAVYFLSSYGLLEASHFTVIPFFVVFWAAIYVAAAFSIVLRNKEDKHATNALGLIGLVLLTWALRLQLTDQWATLGWALESFIVLAIGFRLKSMGVRKFANALYVIVMLSLFAEIFAYQGAPADFVLVFNQRFLIFLVSILSMYAAIYVYGKNRESVVGYEAKMPAVLGVAANLASVVILSLESSSYFEKQGEILYSNAYDVNGNLKHDYYDRRESIDNSANVTLSVIWGLYAAVLMVIGILKHLRYARLLALAGFAIVILKVFIFDVANLSDLYRILSFISLGVILLVVSFLFYRYKDKIKEFILEG